MNRFISIPALALCCLAGSAVAATPAERFDEECGQCHGDVAEFVEDSIAFSGGNLVGRGSEIAVREYLNSHRNLKPDDVDFYTRLLTDVADELGLR